MVKNKTPGKCPVCSNDFAITKLTCTKCGSELTGFFEGSKFCALSETDQYFIEIFVKCRGSIKDVEKELKVSYPTVRSKLDDVIAKLGYSVGDDDSSRSERSLEIIKRLESGEINAKQATEMLNKMKKGEEL
ncbi:MAG: DUF2089 domain-containing protein [Clostridia bacterium]